MLSEASRQDQLGIEAASGNPDCGRREVAALSQIRPRELASKRPDLLLLSDPRQEYTLIEFRRPAKNTGRDEEGQAQKYRDDHDWEFDRWKS